jgi:hypothetical protein
MAAEEGKWEKFTQPGFEESAKTIAQEARAETAEEDAIWDEIHQENERAEKEAGDKAEEEHFRELDHDEAIEENKARDNAAAYIEKNGKPKSYDFYLNQGHDPAEALDLALDDDAHGPDAEDMYHDEYEDEDPLAGDVEPTGGYYEPKPDVFEAQRQEVMRQHGDFTETRR